MTLTLLVLPQPTLQSPVGRKMKSSVTLFIFLIQHVNPIHLYDQLNNSYSRISLMIHHSQMQSSLTLYRIIFQTINTAQTNLSNHINLACHRSYMKWSLSIFTFLPTKLLINSQYCPHHLYLTFCCSYMKSTKTIFVQLKDKA